MQVHLLSPKTVMEKVLFIIWGLSQRNCAFTRMMDCIVKEAAVKSLVDERTSLEVTYRKTKENTFYFLINFSKEETVVPQWFAGMQTF